MVMHVVIVTTAHSPPGKKVVIPSKPSMARSRFWPTLAVAKSTQPMPKPKQFEVEQPWRQVQKIRLLARLIGLNQLLKNPPISDRIARLGHMKTRAFLRRHKALRQGKESNSSREVSTTTCSANSC